MCGIAGVLQLKDPKPIKLESLKKSLSISKHRGPDEKGIYVDDFVGLAHARLSIIGIKGGVQPIHNEDETLWITFNGEIFNYTELKEDLLKAGHKFYTNTDTEVILHLYEEKGIEFLNYLNGQFAFAIWNSKTKELLLARDRVGIRPLHYTIQDDQLIFASEIKSIFAYDETLERKINISSLDEIFTYWTNLPGETVFENILEVPPGHYLKITPSKILLQKYWQLPFYSDEDQLNWPLEKITEEINSLLYDSIKLRLRADVPVGAYLSGGLDSSIITSIVNNSFNNHLKTFGIRFEDDKFDEGSYQSEVVNQLKTNHLEIVAKNENIGSSFRDVLWHIEKPILRTAPVPLFMLSNLVHQQNLKVVLTGEGADEFFGGYNIFRETKARWFWGRNPKSKLRPMLLAKLYPYILNDPKLLPTLKAFFKTGIENINYNYFSHLIRWQNTNKIKNFLSDEFKNILTTNSYEQFDKYLPSNFNNLDYLSKAQFIEVTTFLSNYLLSSQGDRVAMANSIEIRFPFLDHRLIEFLGKVPSKWKILGMNEKFLLKKLFKDKLPERIIKRSKHPYRAPIKQSLLNEKNKEMFNEYCSSASLKNSGIFNEVRSEKLFNKIAKFENTNEWDNMALTGIFSTQVIYDKFVKNFNPNIDTNFNLDLLIDKRTNKYD